MPFPALEVSTTCWSGRPLMALWAVSRKNGDGPGTDPGPSRVRPRDLPGHAQRAGVAGERFGLTVAAARERAERPPEDGSLGLLRLARAALTTGKQPQHAQHAQKNLVSARAVDAVVAFS